MAPVPVFSGSGGSALAGRAVVILLVALLLTMLGMVHLKWWPWLMLRVQNALSEGRNWCNYRIDCTLRDGMLSVWAPHALALLAAEELHQETAIDRSGLKRLKEMSGVLDAFHLNFSEQRGIDVSGIIPNSELVSQLNLFGKKGAGGAAQMMRRLVGGLTRFKRVKSEGREYPVMVRYVGTFYPGYATEAVGLVLDEEWFTRRIPVILDSLAQNSTNLLFFAPAPPDSQWGGGDDPYASPGGNWKQTMGVLHGKDTLWWYGDRNMDMEYTFMKGVKWGYVGGEEAFNLTIKIKTEFPGFADKIKAESRAARRIFILVELIGILLIVSLIVSAQFTRHQAKRNAIALAHLAHAVKTPVARLRLNADTLIGERVESPADERRLVEAVGRECVRLERAVQNAALSIEKGRWVLNRQPSDLVDIVKQTAGAWRVSFEQAGIGLEIDAGEPVQGSFDREMVAVMLDNLLDNALRHTRLNLANIPSGKARVAVRVDRPDGGARITVEDMGAGIPVRQRRAVFRPFRRGAGDALTGVSGLGLGLALVREIAEAHGGKVQVTDSETGSARFVVELPV